MIAALELGYPGHLIAHAMRKHYFRNAGELVDYLWDEMEDRRSAQALSEDDVNKVSHSLSQLTLNHSHEERFNALLKETKLMYRMLHCLSCGLEKRNTLLFPCEHVSLCSRCVRSATHCPLKDCNSKIKTCYTVYIN